MLEHLHLRNVGPAPEMEMDLAPRLNLITGDNGLGKSFLLDVAWWALTRRWPRDVNPRLTSGFMAKPKDPKQPASIELGLTGESKQVRYLSTYSPRDEAWIGKPGRPWSPALVIYAHVDGGFSVWDPARNYWRKKGNADVQERLPAYVFSPAEVWDGLSTSIDGKLTRVCNGLVDDWASWMRERGQEANLMEGILRFLSPSLDANDMLRPGDLTRISIDDSRDIPTLRTVYGDVPILHASAGVRRIAALTYMLVWSQKEHSLAVRQLGEKETSQVVLLVDEIEGHLHPRWQRKILRSVLELTTTLHSPADIQLVAVTHAPLVLASVEPIFDAATDAWFDLDLQEVGGGRPSVQLRKRPFVRRGNASNWLTSDAFDLPMATSIEAEAAIEKAALALSSESFDGKQARALDAELRKVLGDTDPFWARWRYVGEKRGWLASAAPRQSAPASTKVGRGRPR